MSRNTGPALIARIRYCAERRADDPVILEQARHTVAIALEKGLLTLDDLHRAADIATGSGTDGQGEM